MTHLSQKVFLNSKWYDKEGTECTAGFYNPKCPGINVWSDKIDADQSING